MYWWLIKAVVSFIFFNSDAILEANATVHCRQMLHLHSCMVQSISKEMRSLALINNLTT